MSEEFFIANTEYGKVRGAKVISEVDIPYIRFLGIPYAKPPVGNRRFQITEKADAWAGVRDALEEPQPCAGKNNYIKQFVGSDDCLYLNVYTKSLNPSRLMPTIVYIHGGGFYSGSATLHSYSPDYILMSDVVVVIFNYRIGPLGFLKLEDSSLNVPGNAGMKDQQMVMRFVRENIQNFGGDPHNVTLMGHSSGASCVGLHCVAESSKGLFDRAIIMSGSPVGDECETAQLGWARKLAEKLEFSGDLNNEREILKFLESTDVLKMTEVGCSLATKEEKTKYNIFQAFSPHVETIECDSSFLTVSPKKLISKAWSNDIDVMIGGTVDEGLGFEEYNEKTDLFDEIPKELGIERDDPRAVDFVKRLEDFYLKNYDSKEAGFYKLKGDVFRWICMMRAVKARAQSGGKGKTYLYQFAVDSPTQNHYRIRHLGPEARGVSHADELSYFWKNQQGGVPPMDSMEFEAIVRYTSSIASFVTNGNPNNSNLGNIIWKPVTSEPFEGFIFNQNLEFKVLDESERIRVIWEKFYREVGVDFI